MRDAGCRRVYPGAPGTHTVRIRTARRNPGIVRVFRPEYSGYVSPVFELAIAAEWAATEMTGGPGLLLAARHKYLFLPNEFSADPDRIAISPPRINPV